MKYEPILTNVEQMFLEISTQGFNTNYLLELTICECWILYFHIIEQENIQAYCQNPVDSNGNDKEYTQIFTLK